MTLEIRVNERIHIFDLANNASADIALFLSEAVAQYVVSSDEAPLTIVVTKQGNKSPPDLGIAVGESIDTKEALS